MAEDARQEKLAPPDTSIQFRLSTIFVLTLVAGILAAFLRPRGYDMMLAGMVTVITTLIFALAVGFVRPPLTDRVFWGIVAAAMMQAVCANVILLDRTGIYAWPLVAGFAAVAAAGNSSRYGRMIVAAATAGFIISVYIAWLGASSGLIISYVTCASIGGVFLTLLVDVTKWLEKVRHIPQPAIGLALVLGAIGFSVVAPTIIPGW